MILKTSCGEELNVATIILNDRPKSFSFRLASTTIQEVISLFGKENILPIEGYEEFTEIDSIRVSPRSDVTVTLSVKNEEPYYTVTSPVVIEDTGNAEKAEDNGQEQ